MDTKYSLIVIFCTVGFRNDVTNYLNWFMQINLTQRSEGSKGQIQVLKRGVMVTRVCIKIRLEVG